MITLVIGGSGSGKSAYAEQMAVKAAGKGSLYYVATMQVYDEEGKKKVELSPENAGRKRLSYDRAAEKT